MKYNLKFSYEAEKDLGELFEYIFLTLSAPQAAEKLLAEIERQIRDLTNHPFMCPLCLESPMHTLGYRKLTVKNYIVIYGVNESEKTVNIVRIFYGRQDYARFF